MGILSVLRNGGCVSSRVSEYPGGPCFRPTGSIYVCQE